jgi:hypothetical protein
LAAISGVAEVVEGSAALLLAANGTRALTSMLGGSPMLRAWSPRASHWLHQADPGHNVQIICMLQVSAREFARFAGQAAPGALPTPEDAVG